jgi:hypothetical protein
MNDDRLNELDNKIAEKIMQLAPALANAAFRVAMAGIGYAFTTVAGKYGGVVTMLTGSLSSVTGTLGSVAAGALSGLSGLVTAVGTNVVTPIFGLIKPFLGKVVIDEAYKAYDHTKTNKTVTENVLIVDAEVEKAKKSTFRKFANFCEEIFPGSGDPIFVLLCSIPTVIFKKLFDMCCNSEKGKKEARTKIDPPAKVAVTPTKRTRAARGKSPAPNAKTQ